MKSSSFLFQEFVLAIKGKRQPSDNASGCGFPQGRQYIDAKRTQNHELAEAMSDVSPEGEKRCLEWGGWF